MDTTIVAAIIGAAGAVIGAALKTVAPELRLLVTGRLRTNADLLGTWKCTWTVSPDARAKYIDDIVTISKVRGEEFWAKATNTQYGAYKLRGRISRSSLVTLHYESVQQRQTLGGVVIMKLNATRDAMNGYWYEYGREEKIVGGATVWTKASP